MINDMDIKFTVSSFIDACNQTLDYAYSDIMIEGEVAGFTINQGKWVFFDIKDDESSIGCFLPLWDLHIPIEDGMKIVVKGRPQVKKWGKFSFTVKQIAPVGEGNIKKSFELLKKKLSDEGLFAPEHKRPLPTDLSHIGVISSTGAAGYADFVKIINERWGGLKIDVAHTQVQGLDAPDQIIRAIKFFNERADVQIIAILRGGGSADDLSAFNDEQLARTIAASRIPIITGIGHEVDESLADLAADLRASTPSNVAQLIVPDRREKIHQVHQTMVGVATTIQQHIEAVEATSYDSAKIKQMLFEKINTFSTNNHEAIKKIYQTFFIKITTLQDKNLQIIRILESFNPDKVLRRGYAILTGKISPGNTIKVTTINQTIKAEVKDVQNR